MIKKFNKNNKNTKELVKWLFADRFDYDTNIDDIEYMSYNSSPTILLSKSKSNSLYIQSIFNIYIQEKRIFADLWICEKQHKLRQANLSKISKIIIEFQSQVLSDTIGQ